MMAANKKPRRAYRPRGANPRAHLVAMSGAKTLSVDDALVRAEAVRLAVEDIVVGKGSKERWRVVFDALNMAEAWGQQRVADGIEVVISAQDAVCDLMDRQEATGSLALYPAEIAMLRDFSADYAELLSGVSQRQYFLAQQAVENRVRRVMSGERIGAAKVVHRGAPAGVGGMTITVTIPVRLVNGANSREHWAVRAKRAKSQRLHAKMSLCATRQVWAGEPITVTITRNGAGTMDSDGLAISAKHVRDGVADWLGVDDADNRVTWVVRQCKAPRGKHWVVVEIGQPEVAA